MAQFATAAELAARLGGIEMSEEEVSRADGLLEGASGLVQAEARQRIEFVEDEQITLRGSRESSLLLPERPVVAVSSVTLAGSAVANTGYYVADDELVRSGGWGYGRDELVITYTHGYDPIPGAIKEIVLAAAARVWSNPAGVVSERLGQAQMTYSEAGVLLTGDERRLIRHIVGRGSGSVPIR